MKTLYTAEAAATGSGRNGTARSSDGRLDVRLSTPEGLGGSGGDGTNPEQLFAAGYAACFASALGVVARRRKLDTADATVTARVELGVDDDGNFGLGAKLSIRLPGVETPTADELVAEAHEVCPYSRAIRGNVAVDLEVHEADLTSMEGRPA